MFLRKILQPFYTGYVLVTFLVSLFMAFPIFLITGFIHTPSSRKFIYQLVHYWSIVWLWLIGMRLKIKGHFPKGKHFVIVANHISYLDTLNIYACIPEYFRALARKEMVKIPVFGLVYKQLTVMVDRSNQDSRMKSMRLMYRQLKKECHITIFPEGSFNETGEVLKDFYDGAFRLAVNTQTDILPIIFPDTEKRWHYSAWWKLWPGKNSAVFLEPVSVKDKDVFTMKNETFHILEEALKDYHIKKTNELV